MNDGSAFPIRVLITVKAYPEPSKSYGESVCIAGILLDPGPPRFVRLYPVDFRGLPPSMQFKKYDVIECLACRPRRDSRPESLCPIRDTIHVVDHVEGWDARRTYLEPLVAESMCELRELQRDSRVSLGLFRPADIADFLIKPAKDWDDGKVAALNQGSLLDGGPASRPLERIPYNFRFKYRCADPNCNGHAQKLIDWELGESYRKTVGRPEADRLEAVRQRWLHQVCGPKREPYFFVGNLKRRPQAFVIIGVFWPPKVIERDEALALFPTESYR
jgi:hypothetical protein